MLIFFICCYTSLRFIISMLSCSVMSQFLVTPWTVAGQTPLSMGILQARILKWVAMPPSRASSHPRGQTQASHIAGGFFTIWATREAHLSSGCLIVGVLVLYYCRKKLPQIVTWKDTIFKFWRSEFLKLRCCRAVLLLEAIGKNLLPFPASKGPFLLFVCFFFLSFGCAMQHAGSQFPSCPLQWNLNC